METAFNCKQSAGTFVEIIVRKIGIGIGIGRLDVESESDESVGIGRIGSENRIFLNSEDAVEQQ